MNKETPLTYPQPIYLLKVLTGLAVLAMVILAALWLPDSGVSPVQQRTGLAVLLLSAIALVPVVQLIYHRMDELQKLLHQKASMISLAMLASGSCLVGILQASELAPLFNQFWTLGFVVVVWGINLMLADRRLK